MRQKLYYIFIIIAATMMVACSKDNEEKPSPEDDDMPLSFSSILGQHVTRADRLLHSESYTSFGIWAWKSPDGTSWLDVMNHYRVGYNSSYTGDERGENGWGYDMETGDYADQILKYWDLSSKQYDFKGYAPFCQNKSGTYVSMSGLNGNVTFNDIYGHFATKDALVEFPATTDPDYSTKIKKMDWVYCYGKRTLSPIPVSPAKFDRDMTIDVLAESYLGNALTRTSTVPLRFHHLLPKVIFQIHVYNPDDLDLAVTPEIGASITADISTSVPSTGYEMIPSTTPATNIEFVDPNPSVAGKWNFATPQLVTFDKAAGTHYQDLTPLAMDGSKQGWMELPQVAPSINIKLKVDGETFVRTLSPGVGGTPATWEPEHVYVYIIQFDYKTKRMEATSYMEEWTPQDGGNFELSDW